MSAKTCVAMGLTWESRELVTGMSDSMSSGIFMMPSMPVPAQCIHLRFLAARKTFRVGHPQYASASAMAISWSSSVSHKLTSGNRWGDFEDHLILAVAIVHSETLVRLMTAIHKGECCFEVAEDGVIGFAGGYAAGHGVTTIFMAGNPLTRDRRDWLICNLPALVVSRTDLLTRERGVVMAGLFFTKGSARRYPASEGGFETRPYIAFPYVARRGR